MNPMYQKIALSFIRYALVAFGVDGLLSDDQLGQALGAAITLATVGWSVRKNFREQQLLVTALNAATMSEHEAARLVKDPLIDTPSVTAAKDAVPV